MTCIVAVTNGQDVVIGGDSAAVGGIELRHWAGPKVFQVGSYAIGFTTSFRMGQILQYETALPEPQAGTGPDELERFIVTEVIPVLRQSFEDHGFGKKMRRTLPPESSITEEGQSIGGAFLLGIAGQIFEMRQDHYLARPLAPYAAVGSGAQIALGALYALEAFPDLDLKDRAGKALAAAKEYCPHVREPFRFVELHHPA